MARLNPGDQFPLLHAPRSGGGEITVPDDVAGHYAVVLFYRGSWCPYCNAQLRSYQRAMAALRDAEIEVVAVSVDDEAAAAATLRAHGLTFPIGYGVNAGGFAKATGAFVNDEPRFLQSTGFVLDPEGRVIVSVYSSGAIGRLLPDDVVGMVKYVRAHPASPTSS